MTTKRVAEAIGTMLAGFPSSQSAISEATVSAYLSAVDGCSPQGVEMACLAFLQGRVESHDSNFVPTAAKLAEISRMFDFVGRQRSGDIGGRLVSFPIGAPPPPNTVPLGMTDGKKVTHLAIRKM